MKIKFNNKETYNYLDLWFENKVPQNNLLQRNMFTQRHSPFVEEKDGEKIYGYIQFDLFNFKIFLQNITTLEFWMRTLGTLALSLIMLVLAIGLYFDEIPLLETNFQTIFGKIVLLVLIGIVLFLLIGLSKYLGEGTTKHSFKKNGNKEVEVAISYLDILN